MQELVNLSWEAVNTIRKYPINDDATCIDDVGKSLPTEIINEVQIWVPDSVTSRKIFVSSVSLSNSLISVTFAIEVGGTFTPIGGCTVGPSINPYKNYPIKMYIPGASGWVVFGNAAATHTGSIDFWRFSTYAQSGLISGNVRSFKVVGVTSLATASSNDRLTKSVLLKSNNVSEFTIEHVPKTSATARYIDGAYRDCIVFKLNTQELGATIYDKYLGLCDVSPDSDTCIKPKIETINDAKPNCSGTIVVNIEEEIDPALGPVVAITTWAGMVRIDFAIGLSDICANSRLLFENDQVISSRCFDPCAP